MEPPKQAWEANRPAALKHPRSRSRSPVGGRSRSENQRLNRPEQERLWNEPPQIIFIAPKLVPNGDADEKRIHFLDSVRIRRVVSERAVMTRPVTHVSTHHFDTCDYKANLNDTATLETNALCRSIAYKDPNTNVHHIISFENVYDFLHEFEEPDPTVELDTHYRPQMDVQKQVEMSVQILAVEKDKQIADNKFVFHFEHRIRVYCPHIKLQTWATVFRPTEIIDYCDVDPYLSATTAVNPTLLQVHYHRITHHIKLVHLLCRPHHISFQEIKAPVEEKKDHESSALCCSNNYKKKH